MPKLENSNATFLVIFKHCKYLEYIVLIVPHILAIPLWLHDMWIPYCFQRLEAQVGLGWVRYHWRGKVSQCCQGYLKSPRPKMLGMWSDEYWRNSTALLLDYFDLKGWKWCNFPTFLNSFLNECRSLLLLQALKTIKFRY